MLNSSPYNQISDWIKESRPKPVIDEKKLKQAAQLNALGQVFNLIGQGVGMSRGATIAPTQDQVTPYLLNQFGQAREEEIRNNNTDREMGLRTMMSNIGYGIDEKRIQDRNQRDDQIRADKQARDDEYNKNFRLTPEEQLSIYGLKREKDLEYEKGKASLKTETKSDDKKYTWDILEGDGKYQFDDNDAKQMWSIIMADPKLSEVVKRNSVKVYFDATKKGLDPDLTYMKTIARQLWPEIKTRLTNNESSPTSPAQKASQTNQSIDEFEQYIRK